jgi:hypothetical protein
MAVVPVLKECYVCSGNYWAIFEYRMGKWSEIECTGCGEKLICPPVFNPIVVPEGDECLYNEDEDVDEDVHHPAEGATADKSCKHTEGCKNFYIPSPEMRPTGLFCANCLEPIPLNRNSRKKRISRYETPPQPSNPHTRQDGQGVPSQSD